MRKQNNTLALIILDRTSECDNCDALLLEAPTPYQSSSALITTPMRSQYILWGGGCTLFPSTVDGIFTALHAMQTRSSDEKVVWLSVCPSVFLSNACICDKTEDLSRFLYHTKDHLAYFSAKENGWWWWTGGRTFLPETLGQPGASWPKISLAPTNSFLIAAASAFHAARLKWNYGSTVIKFNILSPTIRDSKDRPI